MIKSGVRSGLSKCFVTALLIVITACRIVPETLIGGCQDDGWTQSYPTEVLIPRTSSGADVEGAQATISDVRYHFDCKAKGVGVIGIAENSGRVNLTENSLIFTMTDPSGSVLISFREQVPSLRPGQRSPFFATTDNLGTVSVESLSSSAVKLNWVGLSDPAAPDTRSQFELLDVMGAEALNGTGYEVSGSFRNVGSTVVGTLVSIALFDADDTLVGVAYAAPAPYTIPAAGTGAFRTLATDLAGKPDHYEVYIFDR